MAVSDRLPPAARRCPACNYDLTGSINGGCDCCPECGQEFTVGELLMVHVSDQEGEPISISPREWTVKGSRLLFVLGVAVLAALLITLILANL